MRSTYRDLAEEVVGVCPVEVGGGGQRHGHAVIGSTGQLEHAVPCKAVRLEFAHGPELREAKGDTAPAEHLALFHLVH